MLYLATSPSPVRPARSRDGGAGGGVGVDGASGLRAKGRVLFAGGGNRANEGSFAADDVGMEMDNDGRQMHARTPSGGGGGVPPAPPPTYAGPTPSQLLPPPPSPSSHSNDTTPHHHRSQSQPQPQSQSQSQTQTPTHGGVPFNLNDFINVSPSPTITAAGSKASTTGGFGMGMGMDGMGGFRTDMGRRLFEEQRGDGQQREGAGGGLGAGIDML
jgi:hypothetical protein